MNDLVSILIPLYNAEKYIADTIQSCLDQTYPNLEIIVVDDGSTDKGANKVKSIHHPAIRFFSQPNKGASAARNFALREARGKYIQFLDADDLLHPQKIELQMAIAKQNSENTIISGYFYNFRENIADAEKIQSNSGLAHFEKPIDWLLLAAINEAMFPPMVWFCSRKLIDQAGIWNEELTYNDDPEYFARVLIHAEKIHYCADAICYYRRGNALSLGSRKDEKAKLSEWLSLKLVAEQILQIQNNTESKKAIALGYARLNYSLYPNYPYISSQIERELKLLNVPYPTNFGQGFTTKLGAILGWKLAKRIKKLLKK